MKIRYINGRRLYYAFLAGTSEVKQQRKHLNQINVFPVADGDTGSNLVSTLTHILDSVTPDFAMNETIKSIADASLSGARGNSGIIFAQFINGLAAEVKEHHVVNAQSFGQMLVRSVPYAYGSMSTPVEGTMLTVIRAWAEAFHEAGKKTNDIVEILAHSLEEAKEALANTPEKLEILKKSRVVDSGGHGFVLFLEGICKLIQSGNIREFLHETIRLTAEESVQEVLSPENTTFRYCAEGLIAGEHINTRDMRKMLESFGDSVIVAGNEKKSRIHLHTDVPEQVFMKLRHFGNITEQKADDMVRQQDALFHKKASVALVTDTIADLPQSLLDQFQVYRIPLQVMIDGSPFLDQTTVTTSTFFEILDEVEEYPTSSQPTIQKVKETLEFLLQQYDDVLMLAVSAQNSGTWQVFQQVAQEMSREGKRIRVIDTKKNSGAEGLLVMKAAEAIQQGDDLETVEEKIRKWIPNTHIFVSVATFEYMVRGGRVSPMKGKVAKWLNLKPIVSLDEEGKGIAFGKAFSRKANTRKIMKIVKDLHSKKSVERYCVVHAEAEEKALEYAALAEKILGRPPAYITEISPIVALNAGKGAVALALVQSEE